MINKSVIKARDTATLFLSFISMQCGTQNTLKPPARQIPDFCCNLDAIILVVLLASLKTYHVYIMCSIALPQLRINNLTL